MAVRATASCAVGESRGHEGTTSSSRSLTREEASTYLAEAGVALEPMLVERVVERTEGWIAGLQLAAISLANRSDAASVIDAFGGSQRFVLDYLADEVLGRIDDDLRSFLVQTSAARTLYER